MLVRAADGLPAAGAEGDDCHREDAEVLLVDVLGQLGEQPLDPAGEVGRTRVQGRELGVEGVVLVLELLDRVYELALLLQGREHTGLLPAYVPVQQVAGPPERLDGGGSVAGDQVPAYRGGLLEQRQVLVHQLGDRLDAPAPAVLTHGASKPRERSPPKGPRSRGRQESTRSQPRRGRWLPSRGSRLR